MSSGWIIFIGGLLFLILLLRWCQFQDKKIKADLTTKFPPPGQLVDIGGYRLHVDCQDDGSSDQAPIVILEAAEFTLSWAFVQPEIAKFAKVIAYDRAGLGWSERGPKPRTAENIVEELRTLLQQIAAQPPYVLVGHSKGGMFVRLYAHKYPDEVAGMVLVDATHEEQELRFPKKITQLNVQGRKQTILTLKLIRRLNKIGLIAPILVRYPGNLLSSMPASVREMSLAVVLNDTFLSTVIEETQSLEEQFAELRAAKIKTLHAIPLIALIAVDQFAALDNRLPTEDLDKLKTVVHELQTELSELSSNGRQVAVKDSGHHIHVDHPEAVINAIRSVVEVVQG